MCHRVNMAALVLKDPILGSPVDSNSKVVASVVALVTTMVVGQDKVTRLLNCN